MAVMFPDIAKTRVIFASRAEEQFYEACRTQLSKDWRVYYSCTLSSLEQGQGLQDNEIDFVLYHPNYGVIVVEVKGGRVGFDANRGTFLSINRHGESFTIKNPFQQALNWKSRFLRYLKKHQLRVPVSQAVCLPTVNESDFPETAEIEPELIIGRTRIQSLGKSLKKLVEKLQPAKYLDFPDVAEGIDRLLRGTTFASRLYIRDYLDGHELRLKDVEVIHETLITPIAGAKRLAIEGEAGTGKTMLAVMLAKHFRTLGKSVMLLSSNHLLNSYLKTEIGAGVEVQTYAEAASSFGIEILRRPSEFKGSRNDWIQFEGPERLKEAIAKSSVRYDVLLCDEAQDVQPFWWEALESIIREGEDSRFYIFFDGSQGVFGSGGSQTSFVAEDVLPIKPPYFPLVHNYRTTREIATFSREFRAASQALQSHSGRIGYVPEVIVYDDAADCQKKLDLLFGKLFVEEGLRTSEVTLLSARSPFLNGSVLADCRSVGRFPLFDLGAQKARAMPKPKEIEGAVPVSTIASFKGLETSVGIILNISEYNLPLTHPIMSSLLYVACTRAKHMLYIFVKKGDTKLDAVHAALKQVDKTGALVVENSPADYEFSGTVTHYNPERVGWIKVDDANFEKGTIMFFPYDVERAALEGLRVGAKIKFRPRLEGHLTIACDLKTVV